MKQLSFKASKNKEVEDYESTDGRHDLKSEFAGEKNLIRAENILNDMKLKKELEELEL